MKILLLLLIALPISTLSYVVEKEIKVETNVQGPSADATITKRSGGGSFDFVSQIKKGFLSGAGRASAALASGSSGSSSSFNKPEEPVHANSVDFDPWSLKKSVFNTLFQAVKAITGGVTAIKGQIIKGSGYALSAGGSLIAASGDKITDVGKGIVNSAQLVPVSSHSAPAAPVAGKFASLSAASSGSSSGSSGSVPETGHGPTGHGEIVPSYDIPTAHQSYGPPSKSPSHYTSTSSQYLPPGTYTSGLHFTGPASYESSPHVSYLPIEGAYY